MTPNINLIFADGWLDPDPRVLPAGDTFCCIRVAQHHAMAALVRLEQFGLKHQIGPVFAHHDAVYFIVRPDTDPRSWPSVARFCGRGTFVTVPAPQPTEDDPFAPRWLIAPHETGHRHFTDTHVLRPALQTLADRLPADEAVAS